MTFKKVLRQLCCLDVIALRLNGHFPSAISEMTYTVSSGTLNSTIPYHTIFPVNLG